MNSSSDQPAREAGRVQTGGRHRDDSGDRIRLVLPADPGYGRIARVAVSSLALRLGLTFSEIEDLRIAIDEALILLLRRHPGTAGPGATDDAPGEVTVEFTVGENVLTVDAGVAHDDTPPLDPAAMRRFEEIVQDTVSEHAVDAEAPHVRLVKRY